MALQSEKVFRDLEVNVVHAGSRQALQDTLFGLDQPWTKDGTVIPG
jgi:hypothetical protein